MKTSIAVLLALGAGAAHAQQGSPPDPADPAARVPKPAHESAFAGYRRHADEEPARWREANEDVGRLGGHVGHTKPEEKSSAKRVRDAKK